MKRLILAFTILLLAFLAACSDSQQIEQEEQQAPQQSKQQEDTPAPEETADPVDTYPFTGMEAAGEVNRRAVAVMINNHRKARPQSGLSQADIVFEILAEGNITRLMAIFQSELPEVAGPVRSAREYYFNLASGYNALYIYHGAADFIEEQLRNGAIDNLNGAYYDNDGYLFKRADFRVAPHNSYLQFGAVYEEAKKQGYTVTADHQALPFLPASAISAIQGEPVSEISFSYNHTPVRYVYNSKSEKYLRYDGDNQTVELETEAPIQLDNLFIIETKHQVIDDAGRREIDLQSGGNAYLLQKGKLQKLQWQNVEGALVPFRAGEPVGLVPGKTWINVIPENKGLNKVMIH